MKFLLLVAFLVGAHAVEVDKPYFDRTMRVGTHTDPNNLEICYNAFQTILMCPFVTLQPEQVLAIKSAGLKASQKRIKYMQDKMQGVCAKAPWNDFQANILRVLYMLLRSLSKQDMVWNNWFDGKTNSHALDKYVLQMTYNILATGQHGKLQANSPLANAIKFFGPNNEFKPLSAQDKETKDLEISFSSKQFRDHLWTIVKDPKTRFRSCRRVAYRLRSMDVRADLDLKEKEALFKKINTAISVITKIGTIAVGAGFPAAGPAAAAAFSAVAGLAEGIGAQRLQVTQQKVAVFGILNDFMKIFVGAPDEGDAPKFRSHRFRNSVNRILHPHKAAEFSFREVQFPMQVPEYPLDDLADTNGDDTVPCETFSSDPKVNQGSQCKCTVAVKRALHTIINFFDEKKQSDNDGQPSALGNTFKTCESISNKNWKWYNPTHWFSGDGDKLKVEHPVKVQGLFKIASVFLKMPDTSGVVVAQSKLEAGVGTMFNGAVNAKNAYDAGVTSNKQDAMFEKIGV